MDNQVQGIKVIGTLANIKQIEEKIFDEKVTPPKQILQISVLNNSGISIIDVSDKEFLFKKDAVNKPIVVDVVYTVSRNTAYFRLA